MSEPIYHFVKGEGWVITPPYETFVATMECGTRVRFERRKPNEGENRIWHGKGSWNLDNWIHWAKNNTFTYVQSLGTKAVQDKPGYDWMTVIQLP